MIRIAVAVSGQGRSLENLIKHQHLHGKFQIDLVCASRANINAIKISEQHKIPCEILPFKELGSQRASQKLFEFLDERNIDYLVLAGFLNKIEILNRKWERKCLNIHPSLLPKFGGKGMYGIHVHEAVVKNQEKLSGATVHLVNHQYDDGPILSQIFVPVEKDENATKLAEKVFKAECKLLPLTLNKISETGIETLIQNKLLLDWDESH